uniref:Uncharacterized protein n=1 Tax=Cercocebus atys TaxID=9531 RepID=A0A2K5L1W9_CERAT
ILHQAFDGKILIRKGFWIYNLKLNYKEIIFQVSGFLRYITTVYKEDLRAGIFQSDRRVVFSSLLTSFKTLKEV